MLTTDLGFVLETDSNQELKTDLEFVFEVDSEQKLKFRSKQVLKTDSECVFQTDSEKEPKPGSNLVLKTDSDFVQGADSDSNQNLGTDSIDLKADLNLVSAAQRKGLIWGCVQMYPVIPTLIQSDQAMGIQRVGFVLGTVKLDCLQKFPSFHSPVQREMYTHISHNNFRTQKLNASIVFCTVPSLDDKELKLQASIWNSQNPQNKNIHNENR